jgi:hypothetical protein
MANDHDRANGVKRDEDDNVILQLGQRIGYYTEPFIYGDQRGWTEARIKQLKQIEPGSVEIYTDTKEHIPSFKIIHFIFSDGSRSCGYQLDEAVVAEGQNNTSLNIPSPEAARMETILNAQRKQLTDSEDGIFADLLRNPTNEGTGLMAASAPSSNTKCTATSESPTPTEPHTEPLVPTLPPISDDADNPIKSTQDEMIPYEFQHHYSEEEKVT